MVIELETSVGLARAHEFGDRATSSVSIIASHGAGGGIEAFDLQALATAGLHGYLVEQPWRVAGKKLAPRPAVLDTAWCEMVPRLVTSDRVVLAGRSAGARVACRTAGALGAHSVITLAFPLHPPGKPEASRIDELNGAGVPVLALQGERDAFGTAAELVAVADAHVRVVELPWADHGMAVPKKSGLTQAQTAAALVDGVRSFLRE